MKILNHYLQKLKNIENTNRLLTQSDIRNLIENKAVPQSKNLTKGNKMLIFSSAVAVGTAIIMMLWSNNIQQGSQEKQVDNTKNVDTINQFESSAITQDANVNNFATLENVSKLEVTKTPKVECKVQSNAKGLDSIELAIQKWNYLDSVRLNRPYENFKLTDITVKTGYRGRDYYETYINNYDVWIRRYDTSRIDYLFVSDTLSFLSYDSVYLDKKESADFIYHRLDYNVANKCGPHDLWLSYPRGLLSRSYTADTNRGWGGVTNLEITNTNDKFIFKFQTMGKIFDMDYEFIYRNGNLRHKTFALRSSVQNQNDISKLDNYNFNTFSFDSLVQIHFPEYYNLAKHKQKYLDWIESLKLDPKGKYVICYNPTSPLISFYRYEYAKFRQTDLQILYYGNEPSAKDTFNFDNNIKFFSQKQSSIFKELQFAPVWIYIIEGKIVYFNLYDKVHHEAYYYDLMKEYGFYKEEN